MIANLILADVERLTTAGVILMTGCVGFVLALGAFCFWRILREKEPREHHHVPLDIDTRDLDQ